jgi:hypothetical protein
MMCSSAVNSLPSICVIVLQKVSQMVLKPVSQRCYIGVPVVLQWCDNDSSAVNSSPSTCVIVIRMVYKWCYSLCHSGVT